MTDPQSTINSYWNQRAELYNCYQHREERAQIDAHFWRQLLGETLGASRTVLDVGTGNGSLAFTLAELGHAVTGIDLSEGMLAQAHIETENFLARDDLSGAEGAQVNFMLADAVEPPFAASSFSAITNRYLMWTPREPELALENWHEILMPGGQLVLIDAPWFRAGIDANPTENFAESYNRRVCQALPLAETQSIDSLVKLVQASSFGNVQVRALHELFEIDRRLGVAPGHEPELQYIITASK